ncbi:copper amine oxidase N-terminal domain-containing protein [Paenibacillus zeisoli]|uniref:Copper amine oxidase N-terminal domain-containing protein n=1 Tax=Paenibacillus zeisoli TaxID=2496267 RepID=A0A3S1BBE8_9BACL|nr:copper amine oxidase N-terminal domain-containing protein [Paenibacillus zeisoli]RUT35530.1 copper amine oxidase N-terminal domain-containing protein [Paenibacillus zeisoli]
MKKWISLVILILTIFASPSAYAADQTIRIDTVPVVSEVRPEVRDNRIMVPLRVIGESLGAEVEYSKSQVTLTADGMRVTLQPNSGTAVKNGATVKLDVKTYVKNNRIYVPLRFIAETFGCKVNYSKSGVTVDTDPLIIDGRQVKVLQEEYHMAMGGVIQHIQGNAYNRGIYNMFVNNLGAKVDAPANYSWSLKLDVPGLYYKTAQYDFLDNKGNSLKQFDIYTLLPASFRGEDDTVMQYPKVLVYDGSEHQWYLFNEHALDSIDRLMSSALYNGFVKVISNTAA